MALREPYTPQVVIDGRSQAGGMQTDKVEALLTTAQRQLLHSIADPFAQGLSRLGTAFAENTGRSIISGRRGFHPGL